MLRDGEARAVGHAEQRREPRVEAIARQVGRHRVELEEANVVVFETLPEGDLQLAPGSIDQGAGAGHLVEREVALEIANVDGIGLPAHEWPEADVRERGAEGDAPGEPVLHLLVVGLDLWIENEKIREIRELHAKGGGDRVPEDVPLVVLERSAHALARGEPRAELDVVAGAFDEIDDHVLARLRHVRVAEAHLDAREDAERRDALLRVAHVARAERLAHLERDAATHHALARRLEAAQDDRANDHLVALGHVEANARPRVVGRGLERELDVDVVVAVLLVPIDDSAAGVIELHRAGRVAQGHLRRSRHVGLAHRLDARERDVPQARPRAELHRDHELDPRRALDVVRRRPGGT